MTLFTILDAEAKGYTILQSLIPTTNSLIDTAYSKSTDQTDTIKHDVL